MASAVLMRASICAARAASADGKRDETSLGSVRTTVRSASSTCVAKAISTTPRIGALAPVGVTPIATRVLSVLRSGHEITCG